MATLYFCSRCKVTFNQDDLPIGEIYCFIYEHHEHLKAEEIQDYKVTSLLLATCYKYGINVKKDIEKEMA